MHDLRSTLLSPYYAVTISSDLFGVHDPLVSKEQWIAANAKLIDEIGAEAWLAHLLATLEGDFPRSAE